MFEVANERLLSFATSIKASLRNLSFERTTENLPDSKGVSAVNFPTLKKILKKRQIFAV